MQADSIGTVAVIGAGSIGASWAARFLAAGLTVRVGEPASGAGARVTGFVARAWPDMLRLGLTSEPLETGLARLSVHAAPAAACEGAAFVQENAPERLEIKRALLAEIEPVLAPAAVIASSTSGIMPSPMQAHMRHPERLVIGHPFNPPHLIPLVEVVGGGDTSEDTIALAMAFYRRIGKRPIRLNREMPGHVANRLQAALWREAVHLVNEGVASLADVDAALVSGPGLRWALMGPHLTFHLAGGEGGMAHFLDHIGPAMEDWWADLGAPVLDDTVKARLVAAMAEATAGLDPAALAKRRDEALVEALARRPVLD
ncbi:3-hydroxyacyl-CoA dehydrogenase NAD-binding domain-containing protein [Frigidibacter sp. MR17.14]|uniref:3-hydroxyacyl-CoA dehydrogenase NAD-binding domain-containing protein n=1 Tax=Frigidibacter sp. MR17.14 TaxID=3126509 RepID=UPI003012E33F